MYPEQLPEHPFVIQPHDQQEDDRYMPPTIAVILHDVPDHNGVHGELATEDSSYPEA